MIPDPAVPWPPAWPDAPRYGPDWPRPAYAHRPGETPHPRRDPAGHAFGAPEPEGTGAGTDWRACPLYLYSIDLYHEGYFWEAHEGWEALWTKAEGPGRDFLQALIQNSAAQLKIQQRKMRGAARLSAAAHRRLQRVAADHGFMMGLAVQPLLESLLHHYAPLWQGEREPAGAAPRLRLAPPE